MTYIYPMTSVRDFCKSCLVIVAMAVCVFLPTLLGNRGLLVHTSAGIIFLCYFFVQGVVLLYAYSPKLADKLSEVIMFPIRINVALLGGLIAAMAGSSLLQMDVLASRGAGILFATAIELVNIYFIGGDLAIIILFMLSKLVHLFR